MSIYKFADKVDRISLVNGVVVLSFSSYEPSTSTFRNVVTIKLSLQNSLQMFRVMQEFHAQLIANGVNSEAVAANAVSTQKQELELAAKPEEKARPRRAKRRKTATAKE